MRQLCQWPDAIISNKGSTSLINGITTKFSSGESRDLPARVRLSWISAQGPVSSSSMISRPGWTGGGEIVGADFDSRVCENPLVHRGVVLDGTELPFEDGTFDLVFSRYVLEHVPDAGGFLREVYRVLKPGGSFLFLTPNKWHYVAIVSRCTPHTFHGWYNRLRGREETDTFPTVYRLNSRSAVRRHFTEAGFMEKELVMCECCPNYLTLSAPLFLLGVGFERLVNSSEVFAGLRVNILGHFCKPQ